LPYYILLIGVVLTALYMTRQIIYVFFGDRRVASPHAHESPRVMTMPLIALAICAILFSIVLTPAWPWLHDYLTGTAAGVELVRLIQPTLFLSLVLVGAGFALGIWMYRKAGVQDRQRPADTDPLELAQSQLFRFLENKMWIDELYARTIIAFSWMSARLSDWMDRHFWDGLVRGFGGIGQLLGIFTAGIDERGINAGVDETTVGTRGLGRLISAADSGQIQTYLSLLLVLLTSLIIPFAFLAQKMDRGFCALMLIMQSALYGTFTAQNFVLWFLFYEMSLIPAFLLIKIWGGENRDRAATKFFLYTFLGSVSMLLSFLGIYLAKGTFDFAALASLGKTGLLSGNLAWVAFAGIFLGFAVKVPLFPFHTWLPDAYQTAPTGVSM